jgi:hypothetical protein
MLSNWYIRPQNVLRSPSELTVIVSPDINGPALCNGDAMCFWKIQTDFLKENLRTGRI